MYKNVIVSTLLLAGCSFIASQSNSFAQSIKINNDPKEKIAVFGNEKMTLALDYNKKANISYLTVNGQKAIQGGEGIYTKIRTKEATYSTLHLSSDPAIKVSGNTIRVTGISYGGNGLSINETWVFRISNSSIQFDIDRTLSRAIVAEEAGLPLFMFSSTETWEGAYQDYGGIAW